MNFGWQIGAEAARKIVNEAIDQGLSLFDTSVSYGRGASETILGGIIHEARRRQDVVLATKFGSRPTLDACPTEVGNGRDNVLKHCELSLRRLRTDYIDLLQLHHHDDTVPIEETFEALAKLVRQGKVLRVGLCNLNGPQISEAAACLGKWSDLVVSTHQVRYNLLDRRAESEVMATATKLKIANVAYAPLAEGLLSGKYRHGSPFPGGSRFALASPLNEYDRRLNAGVAERLELIEQCASELCLSVASLALCWVQGRKNVDHILVGASSAAQVRELAHIRAAKLDAETIKKLDTIISSGSLIF